ncbi:flagellar biosynthesis repressor FlbT [Roseivivax sp.]
MPLAITLKPNERVVVNGCVIRNANKRQTIHIENRADIIRGSDLLTESQADTPTKRICLLIQIALVHADQRTRVAPKIQAGLANLASLFGVKVRSHFFEAANHVSQSDYYRALVALRPVLEHEAKLLAMVSAPDVDAPEGQAPEAGAGPDAVTETSPEVAAPERRSAADTP